MSTAAEKLNIESLLSWSSPKNIETKAGPRILRKAQPNQTFWDCWRDHKEELKSAGVACSKNPSSGDFEICWWAKPEGCDQIMQKREESKVASRAVSADISIPVPNGLAYLPFQRAGIAFASSRTNSLIADEMGLGKTIQAIGTINMDSTVKTVLVVCPATLKLNWKREMKKWLVDKSLSIGIADSKAGWSATSIVICNYDILKKMSEQIATKEWDVLIVDEAHYVKNAKAQRSQQVYTIKAKRRLFLTGTPIVNRPVELFPIINTLDAAMWPKFFPYAKRYCNAIQNKWGWDFSGATNLDELQDKLRSTIMVRRLKKDVLKELPAKRRQVIELETNGAAKIVAAEAAAWESQEARVDELRAQAELAKASDDPEVYKAAIEKLRDGLRAAFTEMAKLRHDTALAKVPHVISHLQNALEDGGKIVLFAHHHDVVNAVKSEFGDLAVVLTGEQNQTEKQDAVDRFQKDETCQLFIGSITAAGVGITLTAASHVCFAELDWVPGNMTQAEDRCHRIGQAESVLVQYLVLDGSLDARMAKTLVEKMEVIEQALDREQQLAIPVVPGKNKPATHDTSREQITAIANTLTVDQIGAIHQCLRVLAGVCDFALSKDGAGFNGCDARIGHALAEQNGITVRQAALGQKIIRKYSRQLGADALSSAGIVLEDNK